MYVTMSQSADLKPQIILESKVSSYFHGVRFLSDIIMKVTTHIGDRIICSILKQ